MKFVLYACEKLVLVRRGPFHTAHEAAAAAALAASPEQSILASAPPTSPPRLFNAAFSFCPDSLSRNPSLYNYATVHKETVVTTECHWRLTVTTIVFLLVVDQN